MEYKFKVCIDGCYYYEDEEYEVEISLSDKEIETIREIVINYEGNLSQGLMPILEECSKELYQKFYDKIFPHVFLELFSRDEMFEPENGDKHHGWDEDDFDYLIKTYGHNYNFDEAYIVYIPDDMMPPKIKLSKDSPKDDILTYIRKWNSTRKHVFDWIIANHDIPNQMHDSLYSVIDNHLLAIAEKALENLEEGTLALDDYDPFARLFEDTLADEIYKEMALDTDLQTTKLSNEKNRENLQHAIDILNQDDNQGAQALQLSEDDELNIASYIAKLYLKQFPRKDLYPITTSQEPDDKGMATTYYELSDEEISILKSWKDYPVIDDCEYSLHDYLKIKGFDNLMDKIIDNQYHPEFRYIIDCDMDSPLKFATFSMQIQKSDGSFQNPSYVSLVLSDEEYLELLTELIRHSNSFSVNKLLCQKPELGIRIMRGLVDDWCRDPFVCDFYELKNVVKSILDPFNDVLHLFESEVEEIKKFAIKHQIV